MGDGDSLYRHDIDWGMPIEVVPGDHCSGVVIRSLKDEDEPWNEVPVFKDELLPVARALIRAYEAEATDDP